MPISNLERQIMGGGLLRPVSKAIADTSTHQFDSLDPLAINGRPTAAVFGKGTAQVVTATYEVFSTSDGFTWNSYGRATSDLYRPTPAIFGVGWFLVAGGFLHLCDGVKWMAVQSNNYLTETIKSFNNLALIPEELALWTGSVSDMIYIPSPYGPTGTQLSAFDYIHEPTVRYIAGGFAGYKYIMSANPWPVDNLGINPHHYENACIFASNDGVKFVVPEGMASNPVVNWQLGWENSDPCIAISPDRQTLWLMFCRDIIVGGVTTTNQILVKSTTDLINWSAEKIIFQSTDNAVDRRLQPSFWWDEVATAWVIVYTQTAATPQAPVTTNTLARCTMPSLTFDGTLTAQSYIYQDTPEGSGAGWWHASLYKYGDKVIGIGASISDGIPGLPGSIDNTVGGISNRLYLLESLDNGATFAAIRLKGLNEDTYHSTICVDEYGDIRLYKGMASTNGSQVSTGIYVSLGYLRQEKYPNIGAKIADSVYSLVNSGASDTFNRVDAAVLGTATDGKTWENTGGTTLSIVGNQLSFAATGTNGAMYDLHTKNQAVTGLFLNPIAGNTMGLAFRIVGADFNNQLQYGYYGTDIRFKHITAGSVVLDVLIKTHPGLGAELLAEVRGRQVCLYIDKVLVKTMHIQIPPNGTSVGVFGVGTTGRIDYVSSWML